MSRAVEKSALVIIGNEILSGRTMDKNTNHIAEKMTQHGVPLAEVRIVPDIEAKIIEAVNAMREQYDYVFTTGGIGPTHDDITAETIAKAFGLKFERHEEAYQVLLEYYGPEELTDARASMAMMPEGAELIPNPVSGAPGFCVENVYVMAGVPRIMQAMLDHVILKISPGPKILSNTVACNLPESVMAQSVGLVQDDYPEVEVGSYPQFRDGILSVSIVLRSTNEEKVRAATRKVIELVEEKGGEIQTLGLQVQLD